MERGRRHGLGGALQMTEQAGDIEDQRDLAGAEDGRAADAAQVLEHLAEGLDHGLQFAEQLIDDQAGLLPALADYDYVAPARAARAQAEMAVQGNARQRLAAQVEVALAELLGAGLHALGDHVQGNDKTVLADADLKTVDDRQRQRQADAEGATLAGQGIDLDDPAQLVDGAAHHVHADAASGEVGNLLGGGKPGLEDQPVDVRVGQLRIRVYQTLVDGLFENARGVQAATVILHFQHDHAGVVVGVEAQVALGGLARGQALGGGFDAMVDGVAHQVGQRVGDLVDHRLVQFGFAAAQAQLDLLAQLLADVADHPVETVEGFADFHHAQFQGGFADLFDVLVHRLDAFQAAAVAVASGVHLGPGGADHQLADEVDQLVELVRGDLDQAVVQWASVAADRGSFRRRIEGCLCRQQRFCRRHPQTISRHQAQGADVRDKLEHVLDFALAGGAAQAEFKAQVAGFRVELFQCRQGFADGLQLADFAQALEVAQERCRVEAVAKQLFGKTNRDLPIDERCLGG